MKIYFAGPLFTPYVRDFIETHAEILRQNGIDPFVPHESAITLFTPEYIDRLVDQGVVSRDDLRGESPARDILKLLRDGKVTRDELGLPEYSAKTVFDADYDGLAPADAVLAILDGTQIDDGTACEIGIFYGLMLKDPQKKGIVGLMTDSRGIRKKEVGYGLNLFALGVLEECGHVFDNFDDALSQLKTWAAEL